MSENNSLNLSTFCVFVFLFSDYVGDYMIKLISYGYVCGKITLSILTRSF